MPNICSNEFVHKLSEIKMSEYQTCCRVGPCKAIPLAAAEMSSGNLAGVLRIRLRSLDRRRQYLQVT